MHREADLLPGYPQAGSWEVFGVGVGGDFFHAFQLQSPMQQHGFTLFALLSNAAALCSLRSESENPVAF